MKLNLQERKISKEKTLLKVDVLVADGRGHGCLECGCGCFWNCFLFRNILKLYFFKTKLFLTLAHQNYLKTLKKIYLTLKKFKFWWNVCSNA